MKRMFLSASLLFSFAIFTQSAFAQPKKGDLNLSLGIGAGFTYSTGSLSLPPIGASLDYSVDERLSVGGIITYASSNFDYGLGKYTLNYITIGARGMYHFTGTEKLDPYVGIFLGYTIWSTTWKGSGNDPDYKFNLSAFYPGAYAGGRYKVGDRVSVFAEIGYPILRAGVNLKL